MIVTRTTDDGQTLRARVERVNDTVYEVHLNDHGRIGRVIRSTPDGIETWTPQTTSGRKLNRANTLRVATSLLIDYR